MTAVPIYRNYVNGRFDAEPTHTIEVRNPATGALLSHAPEATASEIELTLEAANSAQAKWADKTAIDRAGYLRQIAKKIRDNANTLARTITEEQGKILSLARVEVDFTAEYIDYMAEWARRIEGEIITSDRPGEKIFLFRKPIGVVAGILPWNFPFFLIARKMAPALLMGNTIVIKPSEETPNSCLAFAHLVNETDLPAGVFSVVCGSGPEAGNTLAAHSGIDMISFTGSVETGSKVMAAAADNITKVNLELGGKAPAIVLKDAKIELAVKAIRDSRIINSGQVCNCVERVYVQTEIADEFIGKISQAMAQTSFGDPIAEPDVDMGPLVNQQGLEKIASMVETARRQGASVVAGGQVADLGQGFHFEPTVIAGCNADMEIMQKEIFGAVLPIQIVKDLNEAIHYANTSDYGLSSSVYTRDLRNAFHAVNDLKFGETYVNRENFEAMQGFHAGTRKSGIGGADGKHGLYEYAQTHVAYFQN